MANKKIKNAVVGSILGALTGGIGGYLFGVKKTKEEMALEPVEVLEAEVQDAALEAAAEAVEQTATQA